MGRQDEVAELSWWSAGQLEGVDLLRWLLDWETPEALPGAGRTGDNAQRSA
jgi:hypothetical protein